MKTFGWTVLVLVFVSEVLALGGLFVWGLQLDPSWLWSLTLGGAGLVAWNFFASPKAQLGHRIGRPVVKVLVFGLGSYGYWYADLHALAIVVLVFSVVVNALALLPSVSSLVDQPG